jgi:uncharacterized protein (DUF697 family)
VPIYDTLKRWFAPRPTEQEIHDQLQKLRNKTPVPLFWLFGKTQSGKTSVVKFLTGADNAEIGRGFRPCTRFSRQYDFPTSEAPLLGFLDTRGVDEPGYDVQEDLNRFNEQAHVVIVTVKALDHAQENVLKHLEAIRAAQPTRPILLALTCLHEGYPQQQHPEKYPYERAQPESENSHSLAVGPWRLDPLVVPEELRRSLAEQIRRFEGLFDMAVPVDLTRPEEGYAEPNFGGEALKHALLEMLPAAYRQTMLTLEEADKTLKDLFVRRAMPHILGYSSLAATAGAFPIPWVDLLVLPAIHTRMIYQLAALHGQPLDARRFIEMGGSSGILVRQAGRELLKIIPYAGSVASGALAGASTYALGKAFCFYYQRVHHGHIPQPEDLKRYYQEQLAEAEKAWRTVRKQAREGETHETASGNGTAP